MEEHGATLVELRLPATAAECFAVTRSIGPPESAALHGAELRARPEAMGFALRDKLLAGSLVRAVDYIEAQSRRQEIAAAIDAMVRTVDVLATFGALHMPPLLGVEPEMTAFTVDTMMTPFNLSGHPALVQCIGFAETGLPVHWQLVGHHGGEPTLLAAAAGYETATAWRDRRPEPTAPPPQPLASRPGGPSDLTSARRFARRHGLENLANDHLARLALFEDTGAGAGLASPRQASTRSTDRISRE